jgi:hypothetical protein
LFDAYCLAEEENMVHLDEFDPEDFPALVAKSLTVDEHLRNRAQLIEAEISDFRETFRAKLPTKGACSQLEEL